MVSEVDPSDPQSQGLNMFDDTQLTAYPARPHVSDGDYPITGVLFTAAAGIVAAIAIACTTSAVGQFFYFPLIFPILMGGGVGFAVSFCVRLTKIRHSAICGILGLISGLATVGSLHYTDFVIFRELVESAEHGILHQVFGPPDEEVLRAARRANSFPNFLQYSAEQGVEFSFTRAPKSSILKLGYKGTLVYWILEAVVIVACAAIVPFVQGSEPFCLRCESWKKKRDIGYVDASPLEVERIIQSGKLDELPGIARTSDHSMVSAYMCMQCQYDGEAVFFVSKMESQAADAKRTERYDQTVLPGEAAYKLSAYFQKAPISGQTPEALDERPLPECIS